MRHQLQLLYRNDETNANEDGKTGSISPSPNLPRPKLPSLSLR